MTASKSCKCNRQCTTYTIGIRCHVSAKRFHRTVDGTKVLARSPGGQGDQPTRQRFCAINLRFIVVAKVHYIKPPKVRVRDCARPLNVESCVGPGPDTPCASVPPTPWLRCAHWSAPSVLAIARRHRCRYPTSTFALVRRRTRRAAFSNRSTTLPILPLSFPDPYQPTPDTSRSLRIILLALGDYTTPTKAETRQTVSPQSSDTFVNAEDQENIYGTPPRRHTNLWQNDSFPPEKVIDKKEITFSGNNHVYEIDHVMTSPRVVDMPSQSDTVCLTKKRSYKVSAILRYNLTRM